MRLISMTDFVLKQNKILNKYINYDKGFLFEIIIHYANFLKQPLELWMFVPCDEEGNILEEPKIENYLKSCQGTFFEDLKKYQQAKERCLFKNEFNDLHNIFLLNDICNIESLIKYNLELTKTAEKLIGL